jgi:predicted DCC family thiol-disulfide oxidoreductase YuxK
VRTPLFQEIRVESDRPQSPDLPKSPDRPKSTIYFDGSCPLCRAEIGYYRQKDRAGLLCFVDVSEPAAATPEGITRQRAMERFHVRAGDGRIVSGAAAFVEVWARLPGWRWAARAASLPGALAVLELGYRMFLPVRPYISRLFGYVLRLRPVGDRGRIRKARRG